MLSHTLKFKNEIRLIFRRRRYNTPKVDKEYINKKKTEILDVAFLIFQKKPLYEMTMLDVIKGAGLSKGGIYRYFSDIDEVIIALINRETAKNKYIYKIDEILVNNVNKVDIIEAMFSILGNYIDNGPVTLGKFQFELIVYLSNHPEKAEKFMNNLTEQENGQYFISTLNKTITEGVDNKEFQPILPLTDIFTYITVAIDGVVNKVVLKKCYGADELDFDVNKLVKIISKSVLHLLNVNE